MTPRRKPPTATPRPRWATLKETAEHARVSVDTVRRWIAKGLIEASRDPGGRGLRIDLNKVDERYTPIPSAKRGAA